VDLAGKACQRVSQHIRYANRFDDQCSHLVEDGTGLVCPIEDLMSANGTLEDACLRKTCEFPLHGAKSRAGGADDLAHIVGLVGMAQKKAKHAYACSAK
jgi:hypothetical protein